MGEYTNATGEHGLVTGFGDAGSVGIVRDHPRRRHRVPCPRNGLTIDDLLAAEVVTAEGEVVEASEKRAGSVLGDPARRTGLLRRHRQRPSSSACTDTEIVGGIDGPARHPEVIAGFLQAAGTPRQELPTIDDVLPAPPMPFIRRRLMASPSSSGWMAWPGRTWTRPAM